MTTQPTTQPHTFELATPKVIRRAHAYPALEPGSLEWINQRRTLVGASEVPAIFGEAGGDEYKSGFTLWAEKTGRSTEDPRDATSPASIGHLFERPIADLYHRQNFDRGVRHIEPAWTEHDDELPLLAATPDFDCFPGALGISDANRTHSLQVKNRGGYPDGWGESGTDLVPRAVLVQVHTERTVTQLPYHDIAAMLGGNRYVQYRIHRDDEISATIRQRVAEWWRVYIDGDVQPPIAGPGAVDYFGAKFPRATTEVVRVASTVDEVTALINMGDAKSAMDVAEHQLNNAKAVLMSLIGSDRGLEAPKAGRVLWINQQGRAGISEASLRRALSEYFAQIGAQTLAAGTIDDLVAAATTRGDPYRAMRFTPAK